MLYTLLNFKIYVPDFDPASYRMESTMLFFRNNASFPRENCSAITNAVAFVSTLLDLSLSHVNIYFFTSLFIMPDGSFERKSSNENKNAMENL